MLKMSYKNSLIRTRNTVEQMVLVDKSKIQDGDVSSELIDGVPSITFSDRIKKFIEKGMAKTIIIKLLGRRITFKALLNRIPLLWKTIGSFQLMDLENDYYLVRFNEEKDYSKFDKGTMGDLWPVPYGSSLDF